MTKKIVVALMGCDMSNDMGDELSTEERQSLEAKFPGREFEFRYFHSRDYLQHAELCRQHKPDVVILPKERPIVALAMDEGFVHIGFVPGQGFMELQPLKPSFKVFNPGECRHLNAKWGRNAFASLGICLDCKKSIVREGDTITVTGNVDEDGRPIFRCQKK